MKKFKRIPALLLFCLLIGVMALPVSAAAPKLNRKTASVYIGKTVKLKVYNKIGKVKWKSSKTSVATVSTSGVVKGKKAGKAVITAKTGTKTLKCTVTVKKALTVNKTAVTIKGVGNTAKIKVNFLPSKGTVTFHIADTDIVSGSWGKDEGFPDYITLTARKAGTTRVTIDSNYNNEKYTVKVTVKEDSTAAQASAFDTLASQIKALNVIDDDGSYIIGRDLSTGSTKLYSLIAYNQAQRTITFKMTTQDSSGITVHEMTIYRNNSSCYVYMGITDGTAAVEIDTTTTRSAITYGGKLYFKYKGTSSYLSSSMQSSANGLNNLFLKACNLTIPRTYGGKKITVSMKDLFRNF